MFDKQDKNPAYGMLCFSRVSGGDPNLFGSSVAHNQKIQLTLKEGRVTRDLNTDWYGGDRTLFSVEMSYTQFAELISAMNVGDGVPVTIRYVDGRGYLDPIDIVNKRAQFRDEFEAKNAESADTVQALLEKVKSILSEKRVLKVDERKELLSMITRLSNAVGSHNDFMLHQFDEAMEKIATEAKGEVEAFVESKMTSLALAAMREQNIVPNGEPLKLPDDETDV